MKFLLQRNLYWINDEIDKPVKWSDVWPTSASPDLFWAALCFFLPKKKRENKTAHQTTDIYIYLFSINIFNAHIWSWKHDHLMTHKWKVQTSHSNEPIQWSIHQGSKYSLLSERDWPASYYQHIVLHLFYN